MIRNHRSHSHHSAELVVPLLVFPVLRNPRAEGLRPAVALPEGLVRPHEAPVGLQVELVCLGLTWRFTSANYDSRGSLFNLPACRNGNTFFWQSMRFSFLQKTYM